MAYLVGDGIDLDKVRAHLTGSVPRWWMPERFVIVDALPRTSVGKLDKRSCAAGPSRTSPMTPPCRILQRAARELVLASPALPRVTHRV